MANSKTQQNDPFALLLNIAQRARTNAANLPEQEEVKSGWSGIGFRIGELSLVAPLDELAELLRYPHLSRVPGTKDWVKGIANIRGNLMPILDLKSYLTKQVTVLTTRSRVLVVDHAGVYCGLLVDEVLGLQHFLDEEKSSSMPDVDNFIKTYLRGSFIKDGRQWGVFSLSALAESSLFMQVAV
jgi:twitching motility protein PilI